MASCRCSDGQSPLGGDHIGPNPTDRGKAGVKRSLLVEAAGGPLGVIVAGANVHDTKLLASTLEAVVVERTRAWLNKCRAILVRYDKKAGNSLALIKLACALLWYRRHVRLVVLR